MLGNERTALGWFRDARCALRSGPVRRLATQVVKLNRVAGGWTLEFFDPVSGKSFGNRVITSRGDGITIEIPEFEDAIAFKLNADGR